MSFLLESKRGHLPPQPTAALLERYGVLKDKIASKMQKIVAANREINALDLELRQYDIEEFRFTQTFSFRLLPDFAVNSWNWWHSYRREKYAAELREKKKPFEAIKEKNHEKLERYEEAYKTEIPPLDLSPSAEDARIIEMLKQNDAPQRLHYIGITLPYITLTKFVSVGLGADPEFIERQNRAQRIFEKAMSFRAVRELYMEAMFYEDEINRTGSWSLFFRDAHQEGEESLKDFGAHIVRSLRFIVIDAARSDDRALSAFVFELTNAASGLRLQKIRLLAEQRIIGRDEFAKGVEAIEHDGALKHRAIMTAAIAELGWPASLNIYERHIDFEYWWRFNLYEKHPESYRKDWDSMGQ